MKELVKVVRCVNCRYYIPEKDLENNEMYRDVKNILCCDGICSCTDKWTYEMDFCSYGSEKED